MPGKEQAYSLYFRLANTPYLAAEERSISVERDEALEAALIRQLLAGPSATRTALTPLFPKGTELIAVSRQGDMLFVTLNEAFLTGYSAEKSGLTGEKQARVYHDEVTTAMQLLRAPVDHLEMIVDSRLWPMPSTMALYAFSTRSQAKSRSMA